MKRRVACDPGSVSALDAMVRVATPRDAPALAALIDLAGRAHARSSPYSHWFPGSRRDRVRGLECIVRAHELTRMHWSLFWVAETRGRVVGALACYGADAERRALDPAEALQLPAPIDPRVRPPAATWTIDHVAVVARARRQTLAQQLLAQALAEGSSAGFALADVQIPAGNVRARRLFERAGFEVESMLSSEAGAEGAARGDVVRMCRRLP